MRKNLGFKIMYISAYCSDSFKNIINYVLPFEALDVDEECCFDLLLLTDRCLFAAPEVALLEVSVTEKE